MNKSEETIEQDAALLDPNHEHDLNDDDDDDGVLDQRIFSSPLCFHFIIRFPFYFSSPFFLFPLLSFSLFEPSS